MYPVTKYFIDSSVLDAIPLNERLLLQMEGTDDELVFCHQALAPILRQNGRSAAVLTAVRDH
jgi:hypothetical protein